MFGPSGIAGAYKTYMDTSIGRDWEFELMRGFVVQSKSVVEPWSVGNSARRLMLASSKGGTEMDIKWRSPEGASKFGPICTPLHETDVVTSIGLLSTLNWPYSPSTIRWDVCRALVHKP